MILFILLCPKHYSLQDCNADELLVALVGSVGLNAVYLWNPRRGRGWQGLRAGSLNLSVIDTLGQIILCCGSRPMHCRLLSSISGFSPLDACNTSLVDNQKCCQTLPNVPWGTWLLPVENSVSVATEKGPCVGTGHLWDLGSHSHCPGVCRGSRH